MLNKILVGLAIGIVLELAIFYVTSNLLTAIIAENPPETIRNGEILQRLPGIDQWSIFHFVFVPFVVSIISSPTPKKIIAPIGFFLSFFTYLYSYLGVMILIRGENWAFIEGKSIPITSYPYLAGNDVSIILIILSLFSHVVIQCLFFELIIKLKRRRKVKNN